MGVKICDKKGHVLKQIRTAPEPKKECDASVPMAYDNNLWRKVDDYIRHYGRHFNEKLATYAIRRMENRNGTKHKWTVKEVQAAMENKNMFIHKPYTYADAAYAANMAYADFYPDVIDSEEKCLAFAYNLCNDPDGYDGQIFNRWTADIYAMGNDIDWKEFI